MSGGKWKGGDGFDVTGEGKGEQRAKERAEEPLTQRATNFQTAANNPNVNQAGERAITFPAVYGVDMQERKRQAILRDITLNQQGRGGANEGNSLPTRDLIGDRQVMLDDRTVSWLMDEQDRMGLIAKDQYFEESAVKSGLFSTPHGLKYLQGIRPDYFKRRRKLAKWVANAQLKLFDMRMNGIQNQQDFDFMYMLQSLTEEQKKILTKPVWLLNSLRDVDDKPSWQPGLFTRPSQPKAQVAAFAGMGSINSRGITQETQGGPADSWAGAFTGLLSGGNWFGADRK